MALHLVAFLLICIFKKGRKYCFGAALEIGMLGCGMSKSHVFDAGSGVQQGTSTPKGTVTNMMYKVAMDKRDHLYVMSYNVYV